MKAPTRKTNPETVILGIDPGTLIMGYGVVKIKGSSQEKIAMGEIMLKKLPNHELKLKRIFERTLMLIDEFLPDEIAIEAPFFGKNVQSMLKLGRAQGVAMAAGLYREVPITEYSPRKIKMAITGSGNASKEQVARMLQGMFAIKELPKNLDATDGLAVAMCHAYNRNSIGGGTKTKGGWGGFVKSNPDRLG